MCPLCKQPLDDPSTPHFCPPTNGHSEDLEVPAVDEEGVDDDEDDDEDDEADLD